MLACSPALPQHPSHTTRQQPASNSCNCHQPLVHKQRAEGLLHCALPGEVCSISSSRRVAVSTSPAQRGMGQARRAAACILPRPARWAPKHRGAAGAASRRPTFRPAAGAGRLAVLLARLRTRALQRALRVHVHRCSRQRRQLARRPAGARQHWTLVIGAGCRAAGTLPWGGLGCCRGSTSHQLARRGWQLGAAGREAAGGSWGQQGRRAARQDAWDASAAKASSCAAAAALGCSYPAAWGAGPPSASRPASDSRRSCCSFWAADGGSSVCPAAPVPAAPAAPLRCCSACGTAPTPRRQPRSAAQLPAGPLGRLGHPWRIRYACARVCTEAAAGRRGGAPCRRCWRRSRRRAPPGTRLSCAAPRGLSRSPPARTLRRRRAGVRRGKATGGRWCARGGEGQHTARACQRQAQQLGASWPAATPHRSPPPAPGSHRTPPSCRTARAAC
jgi:hypothetical protein